MSLEVRFDGLDTCAVSDAADRLGLPAGVCLLAPLQPGTRAAGRVRTVQLVESRRPASRHHASEVIAASGAGEVIVVAGGIPDVAAWGGLLSRAARERSIEAAIIDGACRDADEIRTLAFPVWARGCSPRSSRGRLIQTATDVPVTIAGITIAPGDFAIADGSGVVFIRGSDTPAVLAEASRIVQREQELVSKIERGASALEVFSAPYERLLDEAREKD
jgi:4-hydroxy-4-methyl-2-oxoglutarate aldolase